MVDSPVPEVTKEPMAGRDFDIDGFAWPCPSNTDEHPAWCKCQRVCGGDQ